MTYSLTFDAIDEATPGSKWRARWDWSWPAYEVWFRSRGGDSGPNREECEAALARHMPELVPVYQRLLEVSGAGDREARFLSTWCPPAYLGGCSLAAQSSSGRVRLVRNYDLAPDLNEGFLLRSEWCGRPVMGMVEFLWGLSDGVNQAGLSVALAHGGSSVLRPGFGITTIVRYLLETCDDVATALARLDRLPSHMAYNLVLADRSGDTASVELAPGGGVRRMAMPIATNHQHGSDLADRPEFTRTLERRAHLETLVCGRSQPETLRRHFLAAPLLSRDYANGFGTLFTADYDPVESALTLAWPESTWTHRLDAFVEGKRRVSYAQPEQPVPEPETDLVDLARVTAPGNAALETWLHGCTKEPDWAAFGRIVAGIFQGQQWSRYTHCAPCDDRPFRRQSDLGHLREPTLPNELRPRRFLNGAYNQ